MDANQDSANLMNQLDQIGNMLSNYDDRLKAGVIFWTYEDGVAICNIKQTDDFLKPTEPVKIGFNSTTLQKIENEFDRQVLSLKDQLLAVQTQIDAVVRKKNQVIGKVKPDVLKTEREAEEKAQKEAEKESKK